MDGWRVLTPMEALAENQKETEDEQFENFEEEGPEEEANDIWICSACTFENNDIADACEICTTPKPP